MFLLNLLGSSVRLFQRIWDSGFSFRLINVFRVLYIKKLRQDCTCELLVHQSHRCNLLLLFVKRKHVHPTIVGSLSLISPTTLLCAIGYSRDSMQSYSRWLAKNFKNDFPHDVTGPFTWHLHE